MAETPLTPKSDPPADGAPETRPPAKPRSRVSERLARQWKGILINGIVFTLLGVIAIILPGAATLATELLVGWLLLLGGIAGLYYSWNMRNTDGWWQTGLIFLLTTLLGLLFLLFPAVGITTLTLLLISLFFVEGVLSLLYAWRLREETRAWGWLVFSGVCSLLVALIILSGWPGSSIWAIGLLVGINLLSSGISLIVVALSARKLASGQSA